MTFAVRPSTLTPHRSLLIRSSAPRSPLTPHPFPFLIPHSSVSFHGKICIETSKTTTINQGTGSNFDSSNNVVSRQSSVRFCALSLVFRSLNRIIAIEIAKILRLGKNKILLFFRSLNRIIEVGTSKILSLGILKTSFSLRSLNRIIDLMVENTHARKYSNKFCISLA